MSNKMRERFRALCKLKPNPRYVGYTLADALNEVTGRCDPSIATLVEWTSLSERTVQASLRHLEKEGHITVVRRSGTSNAYRLHPITPAVFAEDEENQGHEICTSPPQISTETPANAAPKTEQTEIKGIRPPRRTGQSSSSFVRPDREEVSAFFREQGLTENDAEVMWQRLQSTGWMVGRTPLADWQAHVQAYKAQGYHPSQKKPMNATSVSFASLSDTNIVYHANV